MAHEKNHDYHILNPVDLAASSGRWRPSCMLLRCGALDFHRDVHAMDSFLGWASWVSFTPCMVWWADVVTESQIGRPHARSSGSACATASSSFIMSEVMFFSAWFWSVLQARDLPDGDVYRHRDLSARGRPPDIETVVDPWHLPLINTLILLLSGCAVTWAHHALIHNNAPALSSTGLWSPSRSVPRLHGSAGL